MTPRKTTQTSRRTTAEPDEKPKRLSLSHVLEMMLARNAGDRSLVTLGRNAAGETTIEVTVRTGDEGEILTATDAEARAAEIYDRLLARYPVSNNHANAEVSLTRNAKGDTQLTVSGKTTAETPTLDGLAAAVVSAYDGTRAKYPMSDGRTARPGSVR